MKRSQNQENEAADAASLAAFAESGGVAPELSPPAEAAPAPAAEPPVVEKLTPAQWAERKGIAPKVNPLMPFIEPVAKSTKDCPLGIHLHAADVLHGWSHHAYQYQAEADAFLIEEKDFDEALKAAAAYPELPAHAAAVAQSCPFHAEHAARAKSEAEAAAAAKDKS